MMLSKAATAPPPEMGDENDDSRAHLSEAKETPSGHDPEIAIIFREMRKATDLSVEQLSGRLQTSPSTISALESGSILELPDWIETSQVVIDYTGLLGLDSRPVLRRLSNQLKALNEDQIEPDDKVSETPAPASAPSQAPEATQAKGAQGAPSSDTAVPAGPPRPSGAAAPQQTASPPPAAAEPQAAAGVKDAEMVVPAAERARPAAGAKRKRFSMGAVFSWTLLFVFFAAMAMGVTYLVSNPKAVWSAVETLPEPASRAVKSMWELVRPLDESSNGKVIVDPNAHKADKLPQASRQ